MLDADVGIIGGGLAGSIAAAILGRAGIATLLFDLHQAHPARDFRCEKLKGSQIKLLQDMGFASQILPMTTPISELWIARFGRIIEKRTNDELAITYPDLVNIARTTIGSKVTFCRTRVTSIRTSNDRQIINTGSGDDYSVRLVILATGLNKFLLPSLNLRHKKVSEHHSVSFGFYLAPKTGRFEFPALTYFSEHPAERLGYISFFPIKGQMRANFFTYRQPDDAWVQAFMKAPRSTLLAAMPGLRSLLPDFELESEIQKRPVDLYVADGHLQPGVVLIGDAFATSCPAGGTGVNKVLVDSDRLCNTYVPRWLETPGMATEKIAQFYRDSVKTGSDILSTRLAYYVRSLAVGPELRWRVRRLGWFCIQSINGYRQRAVGERLEAAS